MSWRWRWGRGLLLLLLLLLLLWRLGACGIEPSVKIGVVVGHRGDKREKKD